MMSEESVDSKTGKEKKKGKVQKDREMWEIFKGSLDALVQVLPTIITWIDAASIQPEGKEENER